MGKMKELFIDLMNTEPTICEKCGRKTLHILSEEGIAWCENCGVIE